MSNRHTKPGCFLTALPLVLAALFFMGRLVA